MPLEVFLLFFFFPLEFLGFAVGVSVDAGFSLNETFDRCGGGVGLALCAGGVVMVGAFCRAGFGDSCDLVDGFGRGVSYPGTLSLDRHCGHTTTPRVSASCSVENSTRLPQLGHFQFKSYFN